MESQEYDAMGRSESTFWWYRSLHEKVITLLRKQLDDRYPVDLLDVGCGTGGMLRQLDRAFPKWRLHGLDVSRKAVEYSLQFNHAAVVVASANSLPYRDGMFDVLFKS